MAAENPRVEKLPVNEEQWHRAYLVAAQIDFDRYHRPFIGKRLTMQNCCKGCWHCESAAEWRANRTRRGSLTAEELDAWRAIEAEVAHA
jgi:hypothetical protein